MQNIQTAVSNWIGPLRGRIMVAFVLIVGMYFVLSFGEQAWRGRELEEEVAKRQEEITAMEKKRDALAEQVDEYRTEQYETYVEQVARRDLNLSYPEETVLLVRWTPAPDEPVVDESEPEPANPDPNWREWLDFLRSSG